MASLFLSILIKWPVVFWARQAMPLQSLEPGFVGAWPCRAPKHHEELTNAFNAF